MPVATPRPCSLPPADAFLALFADALDDFEDLRIRNENRARALRQMKGDKGGDQYFRLLEVIERMCAEEHVIELELGRVLRAHPLGGWVRRTVGVGAKQGARLLAAIGDPFWHPVFDRPRLVSELWAFCGYHVLNPGHRIHDPQRTCARVDPLNPGQRCSDPQSTRARVDLSDPAQKSYDNQVAIGGVAPRKTRGQQANWSNTAKMRCYLVATSCIKQAHSPYRSVYDAGRAKYAESTHNAVCPRCGPTGRPAQPGSPLSLGHQHARAMRLVSKAVLKDLWLESRRIHYETAT